MVEAAWRRRFRAATVTLPGWGRDRPDRALYLSNAGGRHEVYAWDVAAGTHRQVTDRPEGTTTGLLDPRGERIWWFDDSKGNELGRWVVEPFDGGDGETAAADIGPIYGAGLALGIDFAVIGSAVTGAHRIHLARPGEKSELLYESPQAAGVGGLSRDEALFVMSHAEHGDSRNRALRVLTVDGKTIADLWDGPGKGFGPASWSRVRGDRRLLISHERTGVQRPAIWLPEADRVQEIDLDLPGDVSASWYPGGDALLLSHLRRGRTELYRYDLATGSLLRIEVEDGLISGARVRPDGELWYSITRASHPAQVRSASGQVLLDPPGEPAPPGVAYQDVDVGDVHALLARPSAQAPYPTVFQVHGGPAGMDAHMFSPSVQAWVDHGYAVVLVNYRGSAGYGKAWRDALVGRLGTTEMEDLVAVRDHLVESGVSDAGRIVLTGGSWGGYLTLFGLGTRPQKWSVGVSIVPLADLFAHYLEQAEPLRQYFRALAGGAPEDVPERFRESSPLTYVEDVRAPLLIMAGENDPRCPIGQVNNYVERLAELGKDFEVYRYDAGHGSMVVEEQIRQMEMRLNFVAKHLGTPPAHEETD